MIDLLWADDDCTHMLAGLGGILKQTQLFRVSQHTTYRSASKFIATNPANVTCRAALLDIVLPEAEWDSGVATNLGLRLGAEALGAGITTLAFLTVVPQDEVRARAEYIYLESQPGANIEYFDKTSLLDDGRIKDLIRHLKSASKTP